MLKTLKFLFKYRRELGEIEKTSERIQKMNLTFSQMLKSRTVWTAIVGTVIHVVPTVRELVPVGYQPIIDSVLGLLTIYFRVAPIQK